MKIAIDLNGGDRAPEEILKGCLEFLKNHPREKLILCTTKNEPDNLFDLNHPQITVEYFTHAVGMKETPAKSKKEKPDNTIEGTLRLVKNRKADCAFSCGNSGAIILNSVDVLGLKDPNTHPSLISFIPLYNRPPLAVFDVGALGNYVFNAELYFAVLHETVDIYTKLYGVKEPEIKLLNIGTESWKGTAEHKNIYRMMSDSLYNFTGNIEGDELLFTDASVIVTDGLTGNIVLKLLESFNVLLQNFRNFKDCKFDNNYLNFLIEDFNYETIGGAPLTGVNGKVVIGHGKSSSKAVRSALELCVKYAEI
ncbi:TPA: hypothetical protein DCR49_07590 [Candidatus Delongbacteria bacterium]|nr:hypothetical protein [Candidatus Delongbacteria bacterium]